jgi:hypothetical protein
MREVTLTHQECVKLIGSPERARYGMVSIDGRTPRRLTCLIVGDGDLLIDIDRETPIERAIAGRPVAVEFNHRDHRGNGGWTVTGLGLARPIRSGDKPIPMPYTTLSIGAFETGVRVCIARLTGHRTPPHAPDVHELGG